MIISVSFCEPRQTQVPESAVPSFGEKLRKEREQRKITLDDISSTTKISTRMLRALEDEHFDQLPGGVFNKGFVRAYARHIGLDEEQAITDYLDATNQNPSGTTPASVPDISAVAAQAAQMERLRSLNHNGVAARVPWEVLAALLLLLAIVLVFWSYRKRGASVARPEPTSQKESVSRTSSATGGGTPASGSSVSPPPDSPSSGSRLSSGAPPDAIASPAPVNNAAETSQLPASAGPPASLAAGSHAFTLVIRAAEDSWLSIATDAKSPAEETLIAGQQQSIPANRQIVIKAGNVGGLVFVLNGKQLPSQGDYGEVKTLLFDSEGVRLSAHAPARP
jgi:cytoskeleton protein RodZ